MGFADDILDHKGFQGRVDGGAELDSSAQLHLSSGGQSGISLQRQRGNGRSVGVNDFDHLRGEGQVGSNVDDNVGGRRVQGEFNGFGQGTTRTVGTSRTRSVISVTTHIDWTVS